LVVQLQENVNDVVVLVCWDVTAHQLLLSVTQKATPAPLLTEALSDTAVLRVSTTAIGYNDGAALLEAAFETTSN
jgi:hypothetical protein